MFLQRAFFLGFAAALFATSVSGAATIIVDLQGGGDCTEIWRAIEAAEDGDTVLVKPGEYVINAPINFRGKAIRLKSESGPERTTIRMHTRPAYGLYASVLLCESGEGPASILDGFTLMGGRGTRFDSVTGGGGIFCNAASPTILHSRILGNSAQFGGGVCCRLRSSPTLEDCIIAANEVPTDPSWGDSGAGLCCYENCSPVLRSCLIAENLGTGVRCFGSSPTFEHCTIAANHLGPGLRAARYFSDGPPATVVLKSCVVWDHDAGSIVLDEGSSADVSYSCVAGDRVWPGPGNTSTDPLFCAWQGGKEVHVDASRADQGDGSDAAPYRDLGSALGAYSYGLLGGSPCLGGGEGGSDMGADRGACDYAGETSRVVRLAPGRYSIRGFSLVHDVSLLGAGQKDTVVEGTASPLQDGSTLSGLTFEKGMLAGVFVAAGGGATISDCNVTASSGHGIYCLQGASPSVNRCKVWGNEGVGLVSTAGASPRITGSSIFGNSGGGVSSSGQGSSPSVTDSSIEENQPQGIELSVGGSITVADSRIRRNAGRGALVGGRCTAAFAGCTISENWGFPGQGVYCGMESRVTLEDCLISGHSSKEITGGVICDFASVTLRGCRLLGNSSKSQDAAGAVLAYGPSQVLLEGCSIVGNHASGGGCAVYAGDGVQLSLVNCEIVGNRAGPLPGLPPSGDGSVIYCAGVSPTLIHCTIAGNSVEQGSVIRCSQPSPVLRNCVIWGNTPNTVCGSQTSCIVDRDPLFLDPGTFDFERFRSVTVGGKEFQIPDFIVEEPDCYLRSGSPAIDAAEADPAAPTDIAGTPRPCGSGADIGAYEVCDAAGKARFRRGDSNADAIINIADPVAILNHLFGTKELPCLDAADSDGNDAVDLTDAVRLLGFLFLDSEPPEAPFRTCGPDLDPGALTCERYEPCE